MDEIVFMCAVATCTVATVVVVSVGLFALQDWLEKRYGHK